MSFSVAAVLSCSVAVACATYDGLPIDLDQMGAAGSANAAGSVGEGGKASAGGSTTSDAGKTSAAGKASDGGAGSTSEVSDGGSADDMAGAAGSGGKPSSGGTSSGGTSVGGTSSGGAGGKGGASGSGGKSGGGAGGSGGSGGSVSADCTSKSPDPSCSCVANSAHDYWFCSSYQTFSAAESKCTAVGMHLPKVETQAEDDFIYSTSVAKTLGEYYLGSTDASTPNSWSWLAGGKFWDGVADGTPTGYSNWNSQEPNASGDCLVVQTGGKWDDRICTDGRRYICETK